MLGLLDVSNLNLLEAEVFIAGILHELKQLLTSSTNFVLQNQYPQHTVNAVWSMLQLVLQQKSPGSERGNRSRVRLARSCVSFLQCCSRCIEPREFRETHMLSSKVALCFEKSLQHEQDYGTPEDLDIPMERTWTGRSVELLLRSLLKLLPASKVAFRIFARLADVLEGQSDWLEQEQKQEQEQEQRHEVPECDDEFSQWSCQNLAAAESEMWDDDVIKRKCENLDDIEREDRVLQQRIFVEFNGLVRLANFAYKFPDHAAKLKMRVNELDAAASTGRLLEELKSRMEETTERVDAIESARGLISGGLALEEQFDQATGKVIQVIEEVEAEVDQQLLGKVNVAPGAVITFEGQEFSGDSESVVDLAESFKGTLGSSLSILFTAKWDKLVLDGTILEFCNDDLQDSIIIKNEASSDDLVFQISIGFDGRSVKFQRLVIPHGIIVGEMHKYLCTVTSTGQMRVFRDGELLDEKMVGPILTLVSRNSYYIGRSKWSEAEPFEGWIGELYVWNEQVFDWEHALGLGEGADFGLDDGDIYDLQEVVQQLFVDSVEYRRPEPQPLLLQSQDSFSAGTIWEEAEYDPLFESTSSHQVRPAFLLAALLRCCYAVLRSPAKHATGGGIRSSMVKVLANQKTAGLLVTLLRNCLPLQCNVASKFFRLMSTMLAGINVFTTENTDGIMDIAGVCDQIAKYSIECAPLALAAVMKKSSYQSARGYILSAEIARVTAAICKTAVDIEKATSGICAFSDIKARTSFQDWFLRRCFSQWITMPVIKVLMQLVLVDFGEDRREVFDHIRVVFTRVLDSGDQANKDDLLEVFAESLVFGRQETCTAFLTDMLETTRARADRVLLEKYIKEENPACRAEPHFLPAIVPGREVVLDSFPVNVFMNFEAMKVQDPGNKDAGFQCVISNKCFYIVDTSVSGYPEKPEIVEVRHHCDMTRMFRGGTNQDLHAAWAIGEALRSQEDWLSLVCHNMGQRDAVLGMLRVCSQPPDGKDVHRVPLYYDPGFEHALKACVRGKVSRVCYVESSEGDLEILAAVEARVADSREVVLELYELKMDLRNWKIPHKKKREQVKEDEVDDAEERAEDLLEQNAAGGDAATGGGTAEGGDGMLVPTAEAVQTARRNIAVHQDEAWRLAGERAGPLLECRQPAKQLHQLAEASFYPGRRPPMQLVFGDQSQVCINFLDDLTKDEWRRFLKDAMDWSTHEAAGSIIGSRRGSHSSSR